MYKAKCSDCGQECEVPFKPSGDKPVRCRECFRKSMPRKSFGGGRSFGGRGGGFNRGGGGRSFGGGGFNRGEDRGPREMHKAKCSDCGQECEVPFKPSGDKPVRCRECFAKYKEGEVGKFD